MREICQKKKNTIVDTISFFHVYGWGLQTIVLHGLDVRNLTPTTWYGFWVNYSNKLARVIQLGQQDRKCGSESLEFHGRMLRTWKQKQASCNNSTFKDICMYLQLTTQGIAVKLSSMGYALCKEAWGKKCSLYVKRRSNRGLLSQQFLCTL
jgi:hypothetical protein